MRWCGPSGLSTVLNESHHVYIYAPGIKQEIRQFGESHGPELCRTTAEPFINEDEHGREASPLWPAVHVLGLQQGLASVLDRGLRGVGSPTRHLERPRLCYRSLNTIIIARVLIHYDAAFTTQLCVANTLLHVLWLRGVEMLSGFDSTAKSSTHVICQGQPWSLSESLLVCQK